jgi:hypothetical protein
MPVEGITSAFVLSHSLAQQQGIAPRCVIEGMTKTTQFLKLRTGAVAQW